MISYGIGNKYVSVGFIPKEEMIHVGMMSNGKVIKHKTFAGTASLEEDFWNLFESFNEKLDFETVVQYFKAKVL